MNDIYNRLGSDQTYVKQVETNDEIEQILSQIKMVLGTKPCDVMGEPYFGVDIKKYLFSMDYNQQEINRIVQYGILENIIYNKDRYNVEIAVNFGKDYNSACDYAVIQVSINQIAYLGVVINQ